MFLQAVIETVYYFMLPKFTEDCNRLLRNVAAVWQIQRDAWGSAHTACRSTMLARELTVCK